MLNLSEVADTDVENGTQIRGAGNVGSKGSPEPKIEAVLDGEGREARNETDS